MPASESTSFSQRTKFDFQTDLSIALRAYAVCGGVLTQLCRWTDMRNRRQIDVVLQAIVCAVANLQNLAAELELSWQAVPLLRLMHTQVAQLRSALTYARSAEMSGYGVLDAELDRFLDGAQRCLREHLSNLARQLENPAERFNRKGLPERRLRAAALNSHQLRALGSCLQVCAQELLLLRSYAQCGRPPTLEVFVSSYTEADVEQILLNIDQIEQHLDTLAETLYTHIRWVDAGVEVAVNFTQRAQISAKQVLHVISQSDDARLPSAAAVYRDAQRAYRLALDIK